MDKSSKKTMVFASTHSGDEDIFFPVLKEISRDYTSIIIPRHLSRVGEIQKKLNEFNIQYSLWSQIGQSRPENDILIFDHIGYLFNIYKIADIVFMGGTFEKKIGGHNLYEPASQGKCILGGPFTNNFPDIGKELINLGVYRVITDTTEFRKTLTAIKELDFDLIDKKAIRALFQKEIHARHPRAFHRLKCGDGQALDPSRKAFRQLGGDEEGRLSLEILVAVIVEFAKRDDLTGKGCLR